MLRPKTSTVRSFETERQEVEGDRWKGELEPGSEPDAYGDAGAYGDDVDEDFKDRDNEDGGETHRERQVEVLRQLGLTM